MTIGKLDLGSYRKETSASWRNELPRKLNGSGGGSLIVVVFIP